MVNFDHLRYVTAFVESVAFLQNKKISIFRGNIARGVNHTFLIYREIPIYWKSSLTLN